MVPGNHDVPLYNVAARFLAPLALYRRHISNDLEPAFMDDEIAVMGLNTARAFVTKGGGRLMRAAGGTGRRAAAADCPESDQDHRDPSPVRLA